MKLCSFFAISLFYAPLAVSFGCTQVGITHTSHYQDILINNAVICNGYGQHCESRYQAIKKVADLYSRPITVLEIGPAEGYISFRLAYEYDATCVMIQDPAENNNLLLKLCRLNKHLDNIILLSTRITIDEIKRLGECEHFDIVIVMNVVHHFGSSWKQALEAIFALGDNIVIETPPPTKDVSTFGIEFLPLIEDYLNTMAGGTIIVQTPRWSNPALLANTYWVQRSKGTLQRSHWLSRDHEFIKDYYIVSNFHKKELHKVRGKKKIVVNWQKGINLITFKMLRGTYPEKEILRQQIIEQNNDMITTDCWPHNMVLQGKKLILIDQDDPLFQKQGWPAYLTYRKNLCFIELTEPEDVIQYYASGEYAANCYVPLNGRVAL